MPDSRPSTERRGLRVIGLGSPFGDDAAGWLVIEHLQTLIPARDEVELLVRDRPGVGLLRDLEGVKEAILVDAVRSGQPPGTLHRLTPEEAERLPATLFSSHGLGLAEALRLAHTLGSWPDVLEIHGIELADLEGEGLSPAVAVAVATLAARLAERLRAWTPDPLRAPGLPQGA